MHRPDPPDERRGRPPARRDRPGRRAPLRPAVLEGAGRARPPPVGHLAGRRRPRGDLPPLLPVGLWELLADLGSSPSRSPTTSSRRSAATCWRSGPGSSSSPTGTRRPWPRSPPPAARSTPTRRPRSASTARAGPPASPVRSGANRAHDPCRATPRTVAAAVDPRRLDQDLATSSGSRASRAPRRRSPTGSRRARRHPRGRRRRPRAGPGLRSGTTGLARRGDAAVEPADRDGSARPDGRAAPTARRPYRRRPARRPATWSVDPWAGAVRDGGCTGGGPAT